MLNSKEQEILAIVIGLAVVVVFLFTSGLISLNGNGNSAGINLENIGVDNQNIEIGVERSLFDGRVLVTDSVVGSGMTVAPGSVVTLHYIGGFANGEIFDSSYERGEPITFLSGVGMIIPGFDGGIQGMSAGGKRTIVISPELGYGAEAVGPIPANSTLIFEVEIVKVEEQPVQELEEATE